MMRISDLQKNARASGWQAVALSAVMVLGFGADVARAQTIDFHENGGLVGGDRLGQSAIYNGYGAGYECGVRDAKSIGDLAPDRDEVFRLATKGYSSELGSEEHYQGEFRQAYLLGYSDGYYGRDRNLGSMVPPTPSGPDNASDGSDLDAFAIAATNGYNAGYKHGVASSTGGTSFEYHHDPIYQDATEGYGVDMGGRAEYQSNFRQLYSRGYSDGYNGRARFPDVGRIYGRDEPPTLPVRKTVSRSDITQIASASGYLEGYERGRSDRSARKAFGYRRHEIYRNAMLGYEQDWEMPQGEYQTAFRASYATGYRDGHRGLKRGSSNGDIQHE